MKFNWNEFSIELITESNYSMFSTDNKFVYSKEFYLGEKVVERTYPMSVLGIKKIDSLGAIEDCIALGEDGLMSSIEENSFFSEANNLWVLLSDKIYCIDLSDLSILWYRRLDYSVNFAIHPFLNDFIVHGEIEIFRISKNGEIKWRFMSDDIFVTPSGKNDFKIMDNQIHVTNWNNKEFTLNEFGQEV